MKSFTYDYQGKLLSLPPDRTARPAIHVITVKYTTIDIGHSSEQIIALSDKIIQTQLFSYPLKSQIKRT
jgi:hypothetical protein